MKTIELILVLLTAISTGAYASSYRVHIIDPLPGRDFSEAVGINNDGTVLVSAGIRNNDPRGTFTWSLQTGVGVVFPLGTIDAPGAISNNGRIVGACDDGHYWNAVVRNTDGTLAHLAGLPSETGSSAASINDAGQVVGCSGDAEHAVIWNTDGTPAEIGGSPGWRSTASDIDNSGEVVWNSNEHTATGLVSSAYRWTSAGNSVLLNTLNNDAYTVANAISDNGLVVGQSGDHAVLWGTDNIAVDLGASGFATDVNIGGQIVGVLGDHAVLWNADRSVVDLGGLADTGYSCALSINRNGWIVGYADVSNMRCAVVWEPVPEPSSFVALACGLVGILPQIRKRRTL